MSRKPIIAANWKMNKTSDEAAEFVDQINGKIPSADQVETVIGSPDLFIQTLNNLTVDLDAKIAAQNCFYEDSGAYTGETSPFALSELGTEYVIIGHSERRQIFGETDEEVNKKAKSIYKNNMLPIICIGETLEQKNNNETNTIVSNQVKAALEGLSKDQVKQAVLAYEPIWAIGTGKTATAEDANATIQVVRETVASLYDQETADAVRIQYGGSVKPANIDELIAQPEIDGALVGGAGLDPESFLKLLEAVK